MAEKKFEETLADLEAAVERLECGELSLEEALHCYEKGIKSALLCRKRLQSVESKVEILLKERGGSLHTEPAEDL